MAFLDPKKIEKKQILIFVEYYETARIQEAHLFLGHYILNEVEKFIKIK